MSDQPPKRYPHLPVEEEAKLRGIDPRLIQIEREQNEALNSPEFLDFANVEPQTEEDSTDTTAEKSE